jgi:DnaK suppressor protein
VWYSKERNQKGAVIMTAVSYPAEILIPIKDHLENKLHQLKQRHADLVKEDPFEDADRLNDNAAIDGEASEQFGHARIEAMQGEIIEAIANIEAALAKITSGTYGTCESCGNMIDTDRLAIEPAARFCMSCQQKQTVSTAS